MRISHGQEHSCQYGNKDKSVNRKELTVLMWIHTMQHQKHMDKCILVGMVVHVCLFQNSDAETYWQLWWRPKISVSGWTDAKSIGWFCRRPGFSSPSQNGSSQLAGTGSRRAPALAPSWPPLLAPGTHVVVQVGHLHIVSKHSWNKYKKITF